MNRRDLFNPERIRQQVDQQYARQLDRQQRSATDPHVRRQVHRGHAYVLFIVAAILGLSLYIADWVFAVTYLRLTWLVGGIVLVGLFKLALSFWPHRSPFD